MVKAREDARSEVDVANDTALQAIKAPVEDNNQLQSYDGRKHLVKSPLPVYDSESGFYVHPITGKKTVKITLKDSVKASLNLSSLSSKKKSIAHNINNKK